ncbi:MAG: DUF3450 family protein [Verrucomicrobia bacterium]|nr:MAG: DUF3450 family protein [Verrucomicrobiota bacterium]
MTRVKPWSTWMVLSGLLLQWPGGLRAGEVTEAEQYLRQWVQTKQLISRTRTDWEAERETLQQTLAMLQSEREALESERAKVGQDRTQLAEERRRVEEKTADLQAALDLLGRQLGPIEDRLRQLTPTLPEPLRRSVEPLLARLGQKNAAASPKGGTAEAFSPIQRLQAVVTLLNEIEKFNATVTLNSELRPGPEGGQIKVQVLYFGLGRAWYVGASGQVAGVGTPGKEGWQWESRPELAASIRQLIAIYEEKQPAVLVALPVVIR